MSVIGSNIIAGASGTVETGYQIARSLRFNSADSAKLSRTPSSAGDRRTWTWSGWVKRSKLGATNEGIFEAYSATPAVTTLSFNSDNLRLQLYTDPSTNLFFTTAAVFRDVSAWYHIVLAFDTTQASTANAVKIYVNGVQQTVNFTAATGSYVQNTQWLINSSGVAHNIGAYNNTDLLNGYVTDVRFIDGQALTPSSFGETDANTGVWVPKAYTGTYGTNGFWLKFDDNSGTTSTTLGKDSSGNSNNWTPNNFSVTAGVNNDSLVDSPTNYGTDTGAGGEVRGNYATLNPLGVNGAAGTFSNGNLDYLTQNTDQRAGVATIPCNTGGSDKWYCEITIGSKTNTFYTVGVFSSTVNAYSNNPVALYRGDGLIALNGTSQGTFTSYTQNDVIGMSYNNSNGELKFYKNNTLITTLTLTSSTLFFFGASSDSSGNTANYSFNFGQRPFAYTAPSGFKALCTQNLPTPAIGATSTTQADDYFNAVAYSGNSSTQTITTGFQPDLVWIKSRSTADIHSLQDVLRGARYYLISNSTAAEATQPDSDGVSSFTSTGFSLGYTDSDAWNKTGNTYISWAWKANGAGSSNTAGSITSTVSVNTTAGISILTYTGTGTGGATVGHGLGVAPKMIITKARVATGLQWAVYHVSLGATKNLWLNLTDAVNTQTVIWNDTAPSSTVFTVGSAGNTNSTQGMVAYCFAEIAGFSKFGSYTGNGSADGPFVYCGFRPRYVMAKRTDSTGDWWIWDTSRNAYNITGKYLYANTSGAEGDDSATPGDLDILSNGFKLRIATYQPNASGATFIFAAFAEAPFNYARAR